MAGTITPHNLQPGELLVTPHGEGWFLVEIGRGRYVKRFNISHAEAVLLAERLEEQLPA